MYRLDLASGESTRLRGNDYNEHPTIVNATPDSRESVRDFTLGDVQDSLMRQTGLVKLVRFTCP